MWTKRFLCECLFTIIVPIAIGIDRYQKPIVALAILTDENKSFRPAYYEQKKWNTTLRYDFAIYKLLDHDMAAFAQSNNPFASVMQTARSSIKNKQFKTDEDLLALKLQLFRTMFEKGHDKEKIRRVAHFIRSYVVFKQKETYLKYDKAIEEITKNKLPMGILEVIKQETIRLAKEEGVEEGVQIGFKKGELKGEQKGLKKGVQKGSRRRARIGINNLLLRNFSIQDAALIMGITEKLAKEIQQENAILALLKADKTINEIAQQLKIDQDIILKMKAEYEEFE